MGTENTSFTQRAPTGLHSSSSQAAASLCDCAKPNRTFTCSRVSWQEHLMRRGRNKPLPELQFSNHWHLAGTNKAFPSVKKTIILDLLLPPEASRPLLECWPALQRLDMQDLGQHPVALKPILASLVQPPPTLQGWPASDHLMTTPLHCKTERSAPPCLQGCTQS